MYYHLYLSDISVLIFASAVPTLRSWNLAVHLAARRPPPGQLRPPERKCYIMFLGTPSHVVFRNAASPTSTGSTSGGSSQTPAASHSSSASTSGASTTPTNNAAPRGSSVGAYGLAGLMGLVGAALF